MHSVYENMSHAELAVCAFLKELNLHWQYEQPVFVYDDAMRPRVGTPDFYIPELGIYIEVVGRFNWNYVFRDKVYKQNRIPILFIYMEHDDWRDALVKGMHAVHAHRAERLVHVKRDAVKDALG